MANLMSTKDLQTLLRVDRSTIYRMAEDGKLPAIKVGRQWRFPEERIASWLQEQAPGAGVRHEPANGSGPLPSLLSARSLQAVSDLYAEACGTMAVVTDISGTPLTEVSNRCGLFELIGSVPDNVEHCLVEWRAYGADPDFELKFVPSATFGFLCARGFIRLDHQLVGMLLAGGVAPDDWPPPPDRIERMAAELSVPVATLAEHIDEVHRLDGDGRRRALAMIPKVCTLVSRLASDQRDLSGRFDTFDVFDAAGATGTTAPFSERRYQP